MSPISVIIPVYNGERFLEPCINSVCAQTFRDLQIIIINDGSKDGSGSLADRLASNDTRIQVIHQSNQGLSGARNTGISLATGTFVAFLDADDWIAPEMYERLYSEAIATEADLCVSGTIIERGNDRSETYLPPFAAGVMNRSAIEEHFLPATLAGRSLSSGQIFMSTAWLSLYRREILQMHNLRYAPNVRNEDTLFNLDFADHCQRICILPVALHHYRKNAGSMTEKHYSALRLMLNAGDPHWNRYQFRSPRLREAWLQRKFVSMSTEFKNLIAPGTPHQGAMALRRAFRDSIASKWQVELLDQPDYQPKAPYQRLLVWLARRHLYLALAAAYSIRARIDREAIHA